MKELLETLKVGLVTRKYMKFNVQIDLTLYDYFLTLESNIGQAKYIENRSKNV